jgi:outer membrane protein assembly factor BamB
VPGIWSVSPAGPILQVDGLSGQVLNEDGNIWIYDKDGIFLKLSEANSPRLLYPLSHAFPAIGDMVLLPDGGVFVAHTDIFDRRLIAFHADGTIQWEYSYSDLLPGQPILLILGERPYIMAYSLSSNLSKYAIFAIDVEDAELIRVFEGAVRRASPRATWGFALDETRILFNLGGSSMLLLDTKLALEAIIALAPSP